MFGMDGFGLICMLLFSVVGMAAGKRDSNPIQSVCGVLLMFYPYVVSNDILLVLIGSALSGAAWYFRDR
jgi:hypothetical protein